MSRRHPYQVVAAAVAGRVDSGALAPGAPAPTAAELAEEHAVSLATAKRSLVLLTEWNLLIRRNRNTLLVATPVDATIGADRPGDR